MPAAKPSGLPPHVERVAIRVYPRSGCTRVGGCVGDALVVRVSAPAVGGRANEAALRALAAAFRVRRKDLRLVIGATGRDKLVEVTGAPERFAEQLAGLRSLSE